MLVQVLGAVRVWRAGRPVDLGSTGQRAVLGLLALAGGHPLSRAELVDALWGERPPRSAANVIQTRIKHLRRLLDDDRRPYARSTLLPTVGDGYALHIPIDCLDLLQFRQIVAAATDRQDQGDMAGAAARFAEALRLWQGRPLADVPSLARYTRVVALLAEWRDVVARYADVMTGAGRAGDVLALLEEAAAAEPFDEAAQARLVRAYRLCGRRADALRRTTPSGVDSPMSLALTRGPS